MVMGAQRSLKRKSPLASWDLRGGASRGMRRGNRTKSAHGRHPVKREYEEGGGQE